MNKDESEIRDVLAEFTSAVRAKHAATALALLAKADERTFDLRQPLQNGPALSHDPALEDWFATWKGPIVSESYDLTVAVGGDVAYAYGIEHLTGTKRGVENVDLWFRLTACLLHEGGRWRITRMHNFVPFAIDGIDKETLDLKP